MEIHRKVRLNCGFREDLLRPSLVSLSLGIVKLIVANFLVLFARKMMEGLYIYVYNSFPSVYNICLVLPLCFIDGWSNCKW